MDKKTYTMDEKSKKRIFSKVENADAKRLAKRDTYYSRNDSDYIYVVDEENKLNKVRIKNQKEYTRESVKEELKAMNKLSSAFSKTSMGKFASNLKEVKMLTGALNKGITLDSRSKGSLENASTQVSKQISSVVEKGLKMVTSRMQKYIVAYENVLTKTSTNLGIVNKEFKNLQISARQYTKSNQYSSIVDPKEVLAQMGSLSSKGVTSDIDVLSTLGALSSSISSVFDMTSDRMLMSDRRYQDTATMAKATMGMEAQLRDDFIESYGNSQYILNGMYASIKNITGSTLAMASNSEDSLELEYAIQSGLGNLSSAGMTDKSIQSLGTIVNNLGAYGYDTSNLGLMSMSAGGIDLGDVFSRTGSLGTDTVESFIGGFVKNLEGLKGMSVGEKGLWSKDVWGADISPEDLTDSQIDKISKAFSEGELKTTEDLLAYFDSETSEAEQRLTLLTKIENSVAGILTNISASMGGLGSGITGGILSSATTGIASVAGVLGGKALLGKLVGSAASTGGTGLLAKLAGGFSSSGGGALLGKLGGLGLLAGGGALMYNDATTAADENLYSDNDTVNTVAGAVGGTSILGNVAKGAALGAGIGTIIPVGGTIAGGVIGAGVGLATGLGGYFARNKQEEAQAQEVASTSTSAVYADLLTSINSNLLSQTAILSSQLEDIKEVVRDMYNAPKMSIREYN